MDHLTIEELDRRWVDVEASVDATPGIDPWCSGPDWQIPVAVGFAPDTERLLLATDDGRGLALLARYRDVDGSTVLSGLEPLWGFGSPILGPDPGAVATELVAHLADDRHWQNLLLPGLPPIPGLGLGQTTDDAGHRTTLPLAMALSALGHVGFANGITRQLIDLTDGYEAWLERRSPKFRRNLRRAERSATAAGLGIVDASADPDVFDRLLAIERRSWKGRDGSGITGEGMRVMYRAMVERLLVRQRLLVKVAVLDGRDVGYILGGIRGRRYRGLQLSFSADAHALSVGNVLQAEQLRQLDHDDLADVYDLGMDFDYKRRWADRAETSIQVVVER